MLEKILTNLGTRIELKSATAEEVFSVLAEMNTVLMEDNKSLKQENLRLKQEIVGLNPAKFVTEKLQ